MTRFDLWMDLVHRKFEDRFFGMNADDFEDWLWRDAFDSGLTPSQAFANWMEENVCNESM